MKIPLEKKKRFIFKALRKRQKFYLRKFFWKIREKKGEKVLRNLQKFSVFISNRNCDIFIISVFHFSYFP